MELSAFRVVHSSERLFLDGMEYLILFDEEESNFLVSRRVPADQVISMVRYESECLGLISRYHRLCVSDCVE